MPPRRSWLDKSTDIVVDELSRFDLVASREHVGQMIEDRVAFISAQMGMSEQAARQQFHEDALRNLARNVAVELAAEHPGVDLHEEPRTIAMPVQVLGRCISGLAEAAHVREQHGDEVAVHGALQLISLFGLLLHEQSENSTAPVALPAAALTRAVRLFDSASEMLRDGTITIDVPGAPNDALAAAFDRDATMLRTLLTEHAG